MAYSSIAILSLLVGIIINFDILKGNRKNADKSHKLYRLFLFGVMLFYICDALWGILYDAKLITAVYIDTAIYFGVMGVCVFLWTRYVIYYLNEKNVFIHVLSFVGWAYLIFDGVSLIINFFVPVKFYFDAQVTYVPCITRYISLGIQVFMFFITSIYVFIFGSRIYGSERLRHMTVGSFGIAMTVMIIGQYFFPLWPLYAIGYLLGTCLIHTFVLEAEKEDYRLELEDLITRERLQKMELGSTRKLVYIDSLTGVKNKRAFTEASQEIDEAVSCGLIKEFGIIVFDLNGLKTVNDLKGHDAGDEYIRQGSKIICQIFQHSPVYRIGGDEFVAFLRASDYENREKLVATFEQIMKDNLASDKVVISNGLAVFEGYGQDTFAKVFERADKKMYERKRYLKSLSK
ncbi:MAG: GGDEF domain-containing protein [Treponema sp.]|nr:GGDEF domain-containing protein [Treponema sp.]